jgi:predicted transcriptional regulator
MSAKHEPNDATRQMVQLHVSTGTPRDHIARLVGISQPTLRKHYKDELDLGLSKANATIAGVLFNKAKAGDSAAAMFWLKTRAGWSEKTVLAGDPNAPIHHNHSVQKESLIEQATRLGVDPALLGLIGSAQEGDDA